MGASLICSLRCCHADEHEDRLHEMVGVLGDALHAVRREQEYMEIRDRTHSMSELRAAGERSSLFYVNVARALSALEGLSRRLFLALCPQRLTPMLPAAPQSMIAQTRAWCGGHCLRLWCL